MNVGLFVQNYLRGGLDTFLIELINNWPNKNDNITLFCNKDHPGIKVIKSQVNNNKFKLVEYNLFVFWNKSSGKKNNRLLSKAVNILYYSYFFLSQILRLRKLFKNYSFDKFIIVNGSYPGGKACISACIAYGLFKKNIEKPILNIHAMTDLTIKNLTKTYKVQNYIIDILIKHSVKKIISCSTAVKDSLYSREFINNLPQIVIHNGITNITNNQIINKDEKIKIITILANYVPYKGHELAIDAMSYLIKLRDDIKLVCYGDHSDNEKDHKNFLETKIKELNLSKYIDINNFNEDKLQLYRNSSLILIPSKSESFGLTAIEAMMFSLPIIGFEDSGGLKEIVKNNETGYLLKKRNPEEMSKKINYLFDNKDVYMKFCDNSYRNYLRYFSSDVMTNKYYEVINGFIK